MRLRKTFEMESGENGRKWLKIANDVQNLLFFLPFQTFSDFFRPKITYFDPKTTQNHVF